MAVIFPYTPNNCVTRTIAAPYVQNIKSNIKLLRTLKTQCGQIVNNLRNYSNLFVIYRENIRKHFGSVRI